MLVALLATQRMRATTEPQITAQSRQQRARVDRATLWRFHNSLYLGCVIGILTGCGLGQAALSWPKRAWKRAYGQVACQLTVTPTAVVSVAPLLTHSACPEAEVAVGVG